MQEYPYCELLSRARNDLADAFSELSRSWGTILIRPEEIAEIHPHRGTPERKIVQSSARISVIYAHADKFSPHYDLRRDEEDLKAAIRTALRFANSEVTIPVIVNILDWWLQFPVGHHQNLLGAVETTVKRLMTEGEVVAAKAWGTEKTYRLKSRFTLFSFGNKVSRKRIDTQRVG